ncbi:MAG: hypothetical protein V1491_01005 [archaeon]
MSNNFTEKIELAREMFNVLENSGVGRAAEIAKRTFCIQERLATSRT